MTRSSVQLRLTLADQEADNEHLDSLTNALLGDLQELGVDAVERPPGAAAPEGAKGDAFTLGALALVAVPAFLPKLIDFLQAWTLRGAHRSIRIKTPAGLEVEFSPSKTRSPEEIAALAERLARA